MSTLVYDSLEVLVIILIFFLFWSIVFALFK